MRDGITSDERDRIMRRGAGKGHENNAQRHVHALPAGQGEPAVPRPGIQHTLGKRLYLGV